MLESFEEFSNSLVYKEQKKLRVVHCQVRKKWVIASPEEQVRQYCLYVLCQRGYPLASMSVEKSFTYLSRKKRTDILVYDLKGTPFLLVECKKYAFSIQEAHLAQLFAYNAYWRVPYLSIFNGYSCYTLALHEKEQRIQSLFPAFPR